MKGSFLRALVDSTLSVLHTQTGVKHEVGINALEAGTCENLGLLVNFNGMLTGSIHMLLSDKTARNLASAAVKVQLEDRNMVRGIITAIGTGIMGEASLKLYRQGFDCLPSFPVLIENPSVKGRDNGLYFSSSLGDLVICPQLSEVRFTKVG